MDKKQKIFFCRTVSKFQEISTSNICHGTNQIYPEKQKRVLRRDILWISVAVIPRLNIKKVSFIFGILPPAYLHVIKIDIRWWTTTCINLSKSWSHPLLQYFTLLEWFLLIISKKYILTRSTNLHSRNHSMLRFWLRRGRQMPNF